MKNRIFRMMAVLLAAIFVFGALSVSAAPSYEKVNKDYRNMDILNKQGVQVMTKSTRPIAIWISLTDRV